MNKMLECLSKWDDQTDKAIVIIEGNKQLIQSMQKIDQQLTTEQLNEYNSKNTETWQEIIARQQKLVESVLAEKHKIEEQLVQIGQKDKVISSYISLQNDSVFVEKNY